jgi:hypothetical protein
MSESSAALKRAVRQAVASAGGAEVAGLSVSAQTVYRYGHPDHAEFPPLSDARRAPRLAEAVVSRR